MIAAWILYALLVGVLVGGGALVLDALLRAHRRPTRWVWAGAMLLSFLWPLGHFLWERLPRPAGPGLPLPDAARFVALEPLTVQVGPESFLRALDGPVIGAWVLATTILLALFALLLLSAQLATSSDAGIRQPVFDGTFYPSDPEELASLIEVYLSAVGAPSHSVKIIGMIAPHAGYVYSGQVAAYAYRAIEGCDFETVVLMGPSHRVRFNGASAGNFTAYATPLGAVEVDEMLVRELIGENTDISFHPEAHAGEHCIEVETHKPHIAWIKEKIERGG